MSKARLAQPTSCTFAETYFLFTKYFNHYHKLLYYLCLTLAPVINILFSIVLAGL